MTSITNSGAERARRIISRLLRIGAWSFAAFALIAPFVAMQFTQEVNWTASDFVFAAVMLALVIVPLELLVRKADNLAYLAGGVFALGSFFLLVWANGAVGLIGSEQQDANVMYLGVVMVGLVGAVLARFRAKGMALAMAAAAIAQMAVPIIALVGNVGIDEPEAIRPMEVVGVTIFFCTGWLLSASLFWHAAGEKAQRDGLAGA